MTCRRVQLKQPSPIHVREGLREPPGAPVTAMLAYRERRAQPPASAQDTTLLSLCRRSSRSWYATQPNDPADVAPWGRCPVESADPRT